MCELWLEWAEAMTEDGVWLPDNPNGLKPALRFAFA
jgi:hypothetical protein